jgi:transposase
MRYELSDGEWGVIKPMPSNKPRGVPRVDDRRTLNGIFWVLRSGAVWRDLPKRYGPIPPATIASFAGCKQVSGTGSSLPGPQHKTRPCR